MQINIWEIANWDACPQRSLPTFGLVPNTLKANIRWQLKWTGKSYVDSIYLHPTLSLSPSLPGVVRVLVRDEPAAVVLRGARNSLLSHSDYYNTASCQNPVNRSQLGMQK